MMFANVFTIIQPVIEIKDWNSAMWMTDGPIFFSLLAIYQNYSRRKTASMSDRVIFTPGRVSLPSLHTVDKV